MIGIGVLGFNLQDQGATVNAWNPESTAATTIDVEGIDHCDEEAWCNTRSDPVTAAHA